jgi:putative restriction endonuclease
MAFGAVPGVAPGTVFPDYAAMITAGVHRQHNVGMVGGAKKGTESIVLNGGYDDEDSGHQIIYTGFGGRDSAGQQIADQEWKGANAGMRVNLAHGLPVRVIRGPNGEKAYSPPAGYRLDGLYSVEEAWEERGTHSYLTCRFRLEALDPSAGPVAVAGVSPPPIRRVAGTTLRRVRDTAMTRRIKALYKFRCQMCATTMTLPGGVTYAEGAHIRPLGKPHDGDDVEGNVLCLCPNDHLLLDRGAVFLTDKLDVIDGITGTTRGHLTVAGAHSINVDSVRYHRRMFGY